MKKEAQTAQPLVPILRLDEVGGKGCSDFRARFSDLGNRTGRFD